MPVPRGGARRGRRGKQQPLQNNGGANVNNNNNQNQANNNSPSIDETAAIATRTRRRRAEAAAVAAPVGANIVAAAEVAATPEVKVAQEKKQVLEDRKEEVGEKPMDGYDSGGKSPDKAIGADDELASPLPEKETVQDGTPQQDKEEVTPDKTIHESSVGKGLAGALKLLKDRGTLKETIEWGGRNMNKKKSKLVGIYYNDEAKEIHIERTDEYGRILTPKEAFRIHKFHGKGPGKMKQEKRMRQYQEELKVKKMKNADTPSLSVERMREAQAKLQTPYLVLSGHVKPGQTSDHRSGFATVEKDLA